MGLKMYFLFFVGCNGRVAVDSKIINKMPMVAGTGTRALVKHLVIIMICLPL